MGENKLTTHLFFAFASFIAVIFAGLIISGLRSQVLSDTSDVVVTASIPSCVVQITTRPADRIPPVNNWGTNLQISATNLDTLDQTLFAGTSNNLGELSYDFCANAQTVVSGDYDFNIRGFSHLNKLIPNVNAFNSYTSSLFFTAPSQYLIAGETSIVFDNYINGLDLSTQVVNLNTGDIKNDLNQDGLVNSLDLSITVKNLYAEGD